MRCCHLASFTGSLWLLWGAGYGDEAGSSESSQGAVYLSGQQVLGTCLSRMDAKEEEQRAGPRGTVEGGPVGRAEVLCQAESPRSRGDPRGTVMQSCVRWVGQLARLIQPVPGTPG